MKWNLGLRNWQMGSLIGLAIGTIQALSGSLELETLSADAAMIRVAATLAGATVGCGLVGHFVTIAGRSESNDQA